MDALRERMEAIYCPRLDTSLLAALLTDVEGECKANNIIEPTEQQINQLRNTLSELSANATEPPCDVSDPNAQINGAFSDTTRSSWSSDDTPEWSSGDVATSSSEDSNVKFPQFAFLQAAFPHIEAAKLRAVIVAVGGSDGSADMEDVIEEVLNREDRRECRERGIDVDTLSDDRPKTRPKVFNVPSTKKVKGMKLVINDVRQQHHLSSLTSLKGSAPPDPWAQSVSLSTHLATLIPSCNANQFQSAFHNPKHSSPCKALRHMLQEINARLHPGNDDELSEQETQYLFLLFDTLRDSPVYEAMNAEQRDQLLSDARLALRATGGAPDLAWELVSTLLELERDLDVGIYHSSPTTPLSPTLSSPMSPRSKRRSSASQWTSGSTVVSPTSPAPRNDDLGGGWNYIPERPKNHSSYLAASIPAYDQRSKARIKGAGNGFGKGGKGDVGELGPMQRIARLHKNRNQILREATRYWKGGNAGNRGGEVAQYFAERARNVQIEAKKEKLDIVREMVYNTRETVGGRTSIDVHGATVAEALEIVQELIYETPPTKANPLRVITGRGAHSVNGIGVLKPALKNRLTDLGWNVSLVDGGLDVYG